jgi:hypothetical protein
MAITVQVKPRKTVVSSVTVGGTPSIELSQLKGTEIAAAPANNDILIYEEQSGLWVNKVIPVVTGGSF